MRSLYLLFLGGIFSINVTAQQPSDTVFNQTDKSGLKQGYWKVKYDNGALKYTAHFKDNKPVGEMRRYFDDNSLKAIIRFDANGKKSYAKLYYQSGPLAAEGIYVNSLKDSIWKYYSYYTKALARVESYSLGKRNGKSISYYTNGKISEELNWKNDIKDGFWKQYYETGTLKMYSAFASGKRTGVFIFNYPNEIPEWNGKYENDKMEGKWIHYDEKGNITTTIEYKNGVAANEKELREKESELLKQLERKKGVIPEPDETNIMGPSRMN
jgi:antitoxin component YwqK of YwqJK toxin-antitoxin module